MGMQEIAPGVAALPLSIENVYFVGAPGQPWALVDTGTPGTAGRIQAGARERYGKGARPQAILLTHGHTDHVGSAQALSDAWNVPVYAHPLELPYITGQSPYPPKDPTVGGAMAMLSRVFPMNVVDLGNRVQPLPDGGVVPGLPDWEWRPTPGHSPGHVSYFRPEDGTLLAGDAFATVNLDSLPALVTKRPEISLPPTPSTCDWTAADQSVQLLASFNPFTIGCGHGRPMSGPNVAADLNRFADGFTPPAHGRYVGSPARTDENGLLSVPPPAPDLFPAQAAVVALALGAAITLAKRRKQD
jgi:glyoxylase-like metal-dependent hydrolase (beta-lactamase superfamily II)